MNLHNKQFLLGTKPVKIKENWNTVKINDSFYLSCCPNLLIKTAKDLNGVNWYLLGLAIQTELDKQEPIDEIGKFKSTDISEIYQSWAGRWVLIGNNEVHLDCSGLLGCFYSDGNEEKWISSSLAILQEIGAYKERPEKLKHGTGIEWYPLPMTRLDGVKKLLPSQTLELGTFKPKYRPLPKPQNNNSYEEIIGKIQLKMKTSLINVSKLKKEIYVPLTSGYDSRLVLAATQDAKIKVNSFTQDHSKITTSDIVVPKKMSKVCGIKHSFIKQSDFSKEKEITYDKHTGRNINDADRKMVSYGQWDWVKSGEIILRGGIFEVARCFYWNSMSSQLSVDTIMKGHHLELNPHSFNYKALVEWETWVKETPTDGLDWRDRFYLEQRVAGWLSSIEQSLDLTDTERFYVINSHNIISLLLSVPEEKRKITQHHVDLINNMSPEILKFPFNPNEPIIKRIKNKVSRISKMPLSEVVIKVKNKVFINSQ